ncbi:uncharacterized protein LOC111412233 [Olea europaea var. sylvestris]|uniref:Uncharacterized protein n=2 Tax=Olea europaea subsp. europaea TaxID=158383 RepID=A0A8S0UQ92_OLEEU|nr:uncharacterized protein LOC111412233 [Olea europaea var. sylvestris]CAA3020133.1 Hypothetical predicted protein [Olea europaea subsp. europaea]
MALPSAFRERLEQMEQTRIQRLSLLQAEKELQKSKSQLLAANIANIRSMEQRCLKLDCKIAHQHFVISSLKSQIDSLDSAYLRNLQKFRTLKKEVEGLEELEKQKESYYSSQSCEMEEFKAQVDNFVDECQVQVKKLRSRVKELKSSFSELQGNLICPNNSEIAAAENKKSELLIMKENLVRKLASNYEVKQQLKKQLVSLLEDQVKERKM